MNIRPVKGMAMLVAGLACIGIAGIAGASPGWAAPASDPARSHAIIPAAENARIELPDTVDRGQAVTVTVGSDAEGWIEIWGPTTTSNAGTLLSEFPVANGIATLTAPAAAGSYQLRFYDAGVLRARAELEVAASPVRLNVPGPIGAGYDAEIGWSGPGAPGDMIQIVDPANGVVVAETPAAGRPGAMNTAVLRTPELVGQYRVRYWSAHRSTSLAELAVDVGDGTAWLRAPTEVEAGTSFAAEWHGPGDPAHGYQVVDPATGNVLDAAPAPVSGAGLAASLRAPEKPGKYRVRYVNTATGFVLADLPLDVDPK